MKNNFKFGLRYIPPPPSAKSFIKC